MRPSSEEEAQLALLRSAIARLRTSVMAVVFGFSGGTLLALATAWLLIQGREPIGPHLGLLSNYFPGYTVTWPGVAIGFFYGFLTGGVLGWTLAWLYNRIADLRQGS